MAALPPMDGAWIGKTTQLDGKSASEKRKLLFHNS
jgi:hypothetical protein